MMTNPLTVTGPGTVTPELFKTINASVSSHIRKKLRSINIDAIDLELHNSSLTRTCRAYVTINRSTSLAALYVAEQILSEEIEKQFAFRLHAFYWRYRSDPPDRHS